MNVSTPRFASPVRLIRPRGARLLQGHSPKLARLVQFSSRTAFEYWISLEANPRVHQFCERPTRATVASKDLIVDFWVQIDDREELVLIMTGERSNALPTMLAGLPLHQVSLAEHTAQSVWIQNWQRILIAINATRSAIPGWLVRQVLDAIVLPTTLANIERNYPDVDIPIVRGAVFELLRTGRLHAPQLWHRPLSPMTEFESAS